MSGACRPVADWPDLLLGPMVRRVTRQSAGVFIATSVECSARLALKRGRRNHAEIVAGDFAGPVELHRIGNRLWVGLLEAPIPEGIGAGDVVSYDLELDGPDGPRGLAALGELGIGGDEITMRTPLGYRPGMLPSFVLPPADADELRLAHSSCRRPGGGLEGEPDALTILDEVIALSLEAAEPMPPPPSAGPPPESNRERPHQLILTGDQLYADDVAAALLAALSEAGEELLGWKEQLPGGIRLGLEPFSSELDFMIWPGWRSRYLAMEDIVEVASRGSYDFAANHTLTFGEFCAMYMFVWSDALWARSEDRRAVELPKPGSTLPLDDLNTWIDRVNRWTAAQPQNKLFEWGFQAATFLDEFSAEVNKTWEETQPAAERFGASVRKVRRLLANVATYTIFDDHDVTDDWFLNRATADVQLGVGRNPDSWTKELGPRLLRNALSAYTIFQHWGNAPEDFAGNGPGAQLLLAWEPQPSADGLKPSLAGNDQWQATMDPATHLVDAVLGIEARPPTIPEPGTERTQFGRMRWDYFVPFDSHRLIVLDTRTWRSYPSATELEWPQNLDPAEQTPSDTATLGYIEEAATAWADATAAVQALAAGQFSHLLTACVAAARATTAPATEAELLKVVEAGEALTACQPAPWSEVNVGTVRAEFRGLREFLAADDDDTSGETERADQLWEAASRLRRIAALRFQDPYEPLGHSFAALAGLLETAQTGSKLALAVSAAKVATACGTDVVELFKDHLDPHATLALVVNEVGASVESALAEIDPDPRSDWFFRDGSGQLGAQLISDDALRFQLTEAIDASEDAPPQVIVSPAPIFGNPIVEIVQRAMLVKSTAWGKSGATEREYEAWGVNANAMRSLLLAGRALSRCVVLSGDVHYANSSVNDVELLDDAAGIVLTRYIQLTSSSARNADGKTLGAGYADDFLWTQCGEMRLAQTSIAKLIAPGGPDPPEGLGGLAGWAGWFKEWAASKLDPVTAVEDLVESVVAELDEHAMTPLEFLRWQIEAPINSVSSWAAEAAYTIWSIGDTLTKLHEDRNELIFGEYLYSRDVLHQQLIDLYQHVGVDPTVGVQIRRTMLRDLRPGRLYEYVGGNRFDPEEEKYTKGWTHVQFVQTVGTSNVGLVRFVTKGGELSSVRHELLWFPVAEPASADGIDLLVPDGLVVGADQRSDWMGTLHEGTWSAHAHRVDDGCPPAAY